MQDRERAATASCSGTTPNFKRFRKQALLAGSCPVVPLMNNAGAEPPVDAEAFLRWDSSEHRHNIAALVPTGDQEQAAGIAVRKRGFW